MCTQTVIKKHERMYIDTLKEYQSMQSSNKETYLILKRKIQDFVQKDINHIFVHDNLYEEEVKYLMNAVEHWDAVINFHSKKISGRLPVNPPPKFKPGGIPSPLMEKFLDNCPEDGEYSEQDLEEMVLKHAKKLGDDLADVYFAYYVVEDIIPLKTKVCHKSFYRLEKIWLKNVKELMAWLIWDRENRSIEFGSKDNDYFTACWIVRTMLLNPDKGEPKHFENVKKYLIKHYLKLSKTDPDGEKYVINEGKPEVEDLIKRKAHRIWELGGGKSEENWNMAKLYVQLFYENIIYAIEEKNNTESLKNVLRAFRWSKAPKDFYLSYINKTLDEALSDSNNNSLQAFRWSKAPENSFKIVNCFETAIAINFLDATKLKEVFLSLGLSVEDIL